MGGLKRKTRSYSSNAQTLAVYRPFSYPKGKKRRVVPGITRTGGYYGRFTGAKPEMKFLDSDYNDSVVSAAGTIRNTIVDIAQGTGESQRIGRKCTIRSLHWRVHVALPEFSGTKPGDPDTCRIMLYIDKQCNGATAAVLDILEDATFLSWRNLANSGRFDILMDKYVVLNVLTASSDTSGTTESSSNHRQFDFHKTMSLPIEFNSTAGAITEIRSNNIGFLAISAGGLVGFSSKLRIRFSDM